MLTEHELEQLRLALEECQQQRAIEAAIADAGACLSSLAERENEGTRANAA